MSALTRMAPLSMLPVVALTVSSGMSYDSERQNARAVPDPLGLLPSPKIADGVVTAGKLGLHPPGYAGIMRFTRADRDKMSELLGRHYAAGSLDDEEFSVRLDKAERAVLYQDLVALRADLPPLPPEPVSPPAPPRGENPVYRSWTREQWLGQNVGAVVVALASMAVSGAAGGSLIMLSVLACAAVNGFLGWRKNKVLLAAGIFSGIFLVVGTVLMIALTWRRSRRLVR